VRKQMLAVIFVFLIPHFLGGQEIPVSGQCNKRTLSNWKIVSDSAGGALASDLRAAEIDSPAALRFLTPNWRPLLARRQVMCAKVFTRKANAFEEANLWSSGNDWNFYLIPQAPFDGVFQDALALIPGKSSVWSCKDGNPPKEGGTPGNCMEAEVWPEESLEAWFKSDAFNLSLPNGSLACAYGPLVTEHVHGGRPEIHPLEVFWWQSPTSGRWTFIQVQDSSDRFDRRIDFAGNPFPPDWEPWASPRFDAMRVAIELPLQQPNPVSLDVDQDPGLAQNAKPAEDPHPGQQHTYTYLGKPVLMVTEGPHQVANAVSVRDFCRDDSQNRLIGYLDLRAEVGNDSGFGYQVTYVSKHGTVTPTNFFKPTTAAKFELLPQSIRVNETPQGLQILGDVEIRMSRLSGNSEIHAFSKEGGKSTSIAGAAPSQTKSESAYILRNLDLLKLDELQLGDSTSKRAGRALYAFVEVSGREPFEESQQSAQLLSAFLGVPVPKELMIKPERLEHESLLLTPRYVLLTNDEVEPEDGTPIHDLLNQNINLMIKDSRPDNRVSLDPPEFQGIDCGTQKHIDCEQGAAVSVVQVKPSNAHPDIRVVYIPTDDNPARVEIYWPTYTTDHLYKLKVTIRYHGPHADKLVPYVAEYWSDDIPVKDTSPEQIEAVITTVAQFAGIAPTSLAMPAFDDSDPLYVVNNTRYRRAMMLRMAAATFARDTNAIEPDQLQVLVNAAKTLSASTAR